MRRFIVAAVVLVAAQVAFAQGEAASAAPTPPAAPAAAPKAAEPKPAAEVKPAAAEVKPAAAETKPAEPNPAAEAKKADAAPATSVQPASATSATGLDVRPASATVKRKKTPADGGTDAAAAMAPLPAVPSPTDAAAPSGKPVPSKEQQEKEVREAVQNLNQKTADLQKQMDAQPSVPQGPKDLVEASARDLFFAMMNGDARTITEESVTPFMLEDQRIENPDELFQQWLKHLRTKRTDLLVLYGVEVLTPDEMEKKYGKPPARLASFPWKNAKTYVAIGNLSGHAAIALFRETRPSEFYLVGYTD